MAVPRLWLLRSTYNHTAARAYARQLECAGGKDYLQGRATRATVGSVAASRATRARVLASQASSAGVLLRPYMRSLVKTYHSWMEDEALRGTSPRRKRLAGGSPITIRLASLATSIFFALIASQRQLRRKGSAWTRSWRCSARGRRTLTVRVQRQLSGRAQAQRPSCTRLFRFLRRVDIHRVCFGGGRSSDAAVGRGAAGRCGRLGGRRCLGQGHGRRRESVLLGRRRR